MRLNEVLGHRVHDSDGDDIGGVADVRLIQDGPMLTSMQRALRVDGLIVVENHATRLFGYERHLGPALLRRLVHSRLGAVWYLPWDQVEEISGGAVIARCGRSDLRPLETMSRY